MILTILGNFVVFILGLSVTIGCISLMIFIYKLKKGQPGKDY